MIPAPLGGGAVPVPAAGEAEVTTGMRDQEEVMIPITVVTTTVVAGEITTTADLTTRVMAVIVGAVMVEGITRMAVATATEVTGMEDTEITTPVAGEVTPCLTPLTMDSSDLLGISKIGLRSYPAAFKKPCLFCFSKRYSQWTILLVLYVFPLFRLGPSSDGPHLPSILQRPFAPACQYG